MTATKNRYQTTSKKDAEKKGFAPITDGYKEDELDLLDKTIAGLAGVAFLLVPCYDGIRVYRKESELKTTKQERGWW